MFAWQATVQDEFGNAVTLPVVTVYEADGVTLADIYDEDGIAIDNPLTGTLEGFVQFWAETGRYKIVGADGGDQTAEWLFSAGSAEVNAFADLAGLKPGALRVGDLIRVIETGAVYRRVSSGGDIDYSGIGGVRLEQIPTIDGQISVDALLPDSPTPAETRAAILRADAVARAAGLIATTRAGRTYVVDQPITLTAQRWISRGYIKQADSAQLPYILRLNVGGGDGLPIDLSFAVDCNFDENSDVSVASGALPDRSFYFVDTLASGDNFANVGLHENRAPSGFLSRGGTPTTWANGTVLRRPTVGVLVDAVNSPLSSVRIYVKNHSAGVVIAGETEKGTVEIHHENPGTRRAGVACIVNGSTTAGTPDDLKIKVSAVNYGGLIWKTGSEKSTFDAEVNAEQGGDDGIAFLGHNWWGSLYGLVRAMRGRAFQFYGPAGTRLDFGVQILAGLDEASSSVNADIGVIENAARLSGTISVAGETHKTGLSIWQCAPSFDLSYLSDALATERGLQLGDNAGAVLFSRRGLRKIVSLGSGSAPGVVFDRVARCDFQSIHTNRVHIKNSASRDNNIRLEPVSGVVVALSDGAAPGTNIIRSSVRGLSEISAFNGGAPIEGMVLDFTSPLAGFSAAYDQTGASGGTLGWTDSTGTVLAAGASYAPARGTATILDTETSVVVTHNLGFTPVWQQIALRTNSGNAVHVSAVNSTTFTITAAAAASGAQGVLWDIRSLARKVT